ACYCCTGSKYLQIRLSINSFQTRERKSLIPDIDYDKRFASVLQERQATTGRLRQEKKRESPPTYGPQELRPTWLVARGGGSDEGGGGRRRRRRPPGQGCRGALHDHGEGGENARGGRPRAGGGRRQRGPDPPATAGDTELRTKAWVRRVLVGLGVCPFTKSAERSGQGLQGLGVPVAGIMYRHSDASGGGAGVYELLASEFLFLEKHPLVFPPDVLRKPSILARGRFSPAEENFPTFFLTVSRIPATETQSAERTKRRLGVNLRDGRPGSLRQARRQQHPPLGSGVRLRLRPLGRSGLRHARVGRGGGPGRGDGGRRLLPSRM
ncbi:hypothetical protein THAOC_33592, partial [Thalassiosira oceanica]